jgi:hypothetical protein
MYVSFFFFKEEDEEEVGTFFRAGESPRVLTPAFRLVFVALLGFFTALLGFFTALLGFFMAILGLFVALLGFLIAIFFAILSIAIRGLFSDVMALCGWCMLCLALAPTVLRMGVLFPTPMGARGIRPASFAGAISFLFGAVILLGVAGLARDPVVACVGVATAGVRGTGPIWGKRGTASALACTGPA